jgi:AAA family ATP:ADP antiporter
VTSTEEPTIPPRTAVERLLGAFTDVRPGEGMTVLAMALNVFLILTAYYLIKPVREALVLSLQGGAEIKSIASAGQALLLLVAVPAYGWLACRVPRLRLITSVTLFFCACLALFYVLIKARVPLAVPFFLWVGIFNLMIPAQFWAFANDIYSAAAGKRLFVIIAFGASAGAVFGSLLADEMIRFVGVYEMLLLSAALLGATLSLVHYVSRREQEQNASAMAADQPLEEGNAFGLVFRNRYLLLIALMLLLNNWVNSNGEYLLGRIVEEAAAAADGVSQDEFIAAFYARYFGSVNLVGMLLQLFIVSRVIKYIGVPVALCLLPLITLGSYATIVAIPVLGVVRWAKTAENATDYSLQSTIKQVLYLPTSRTEKYKAKQAIDTFFVRAGDVCSAGLILVGTQVMSFGVAQFAVATMVLCCIWLLLATLAGLRFRRLLPAKADPQQAVENG